MGEEGHCSSRVDVVDHNEQNSNKNAPEESESDGHSPDEIFTQSLLHESEIENAKNANNTNGPHLNANRDKCIDVQDAGDNQQSGVILAKSSDAPKPGDNVNDAEGRATKASEPKEIFHRNIKKGLGSGGLIADAANHVVMDDNGADQEEAEDEDPDDVDAGRGVNHVLGRQ